MLRQLRGVQKGIEANPRAQCYRDIYEAVKKYRHSKVMRTAFVVMGDFNEEYSDGASVTSLYSGIVAFSDVMQLKDAMMHKHGGDHGAMKYWTRAENGSHSSPDHILVSKQLLSKNALTRVGVWQGNQNFGSDHRMMGLELQTERWLGRDARRLRLRRPVHRVRSPMLYLNDKEKVYRYQVMVNELLALSDCDEICRQIETMIEARIAAGTPFGHNDPILQAAMDRLDDVFFGILLRCKDAVAGRPTVSGTKHRSPFKGPSSAYQKIVGKEVRDIDKLLHLQEISKGAASVRAISFVQKHNATWLGKIDIVSWKAIDWEAWRIRLIHRKRVVLKTCNAAWRERQRANIQANRAWIKKAFKEKKQKALIARVKGERATMIDRDCVITGEGDEAVCLDTASAIGDALRDHFAQWFREGHDSWYQQWENGKVIYTHPLFRNDADGMRLRQKVVDGLSNDFDPEFEKWLHSEVLPGIPEQVRWVLRLYARKYTEVLKRRVTQDDYRRRGVMQIITEDAHEMYWIKKGANKAVDFRGINANLIKALRKVAYWTDDEGRSRSGVLTWKAFQMVRYMLNLVIRTGLAYSTWMDEVMLTVPKVIGSLLLSEVRPIGLLALLRNAFFGMQYVLVKNTWDELLLVATTQFGAQRGLGTAQFRMSEMAIYEHCYIYIKPVGKGNEDKRKGYDRPPITGGYQMGMMRLALPTELLWLDLLVGVGGRIHVRFAYGFAPMFQRSGFGSCGFGATQGSDDGPDKYNAFEDPLNTWWEQQDMGVWVEVSEWKKVQLKGGGFVDDVGIETLVHAV